MSERSINACSVRREVARVTIGTHVDSIAPECPSLNGLIAAKRRHKCTTKYCVFGPLSQLPSQPFASGVDDEALYPRCLPTKSRVSTRNYAPDQF